MSPLYAMGMLAIAAHLVWRTWRIDLARPEVNYRLFLANILTGVPVAGAAIAEPENAMISSWNTDNLDPPQL